MSRTREEIKNYFNERPELKEKIEAIKLKELDGDGVSPYWRGIFIDFLIDNYKHLVGTPFADEQGEEYNAYAIANSIHMEMDREELREDCIQFWDWYLGDAVTDHLVGYKGFDKDMKCRGFQYEVGKEYEHEGLVSLCDNGFHACENPLDVLRYYSYFDSRYCIVEQWGKIETGKDKRVSSNIKIIKEISLKELLDIAAEKMQRVGKQNACVTNHPCKKIRCSQHQIALAGDSGSLIIPDNDGWCDMLGGNNAIGITGSRNTVCISGDSNRIYIFGDLNRIVVNGIVNTIYAMEGYNNEIITVGRNNIVQAKKSANITCIGDGGVARGGQDSHITIVGEEKYMPSIGREDRVWGGQGSHITLVNEKKTESFIVNDEDIKGDK